MLQKKVEDSENWSYPFFQLVFFGNTQFIYFFIFFYKQCFLSFPNILTILYLTIAEGLIGLYQQKVLPHHSIGIYLSQYLFWVEEAGQPPEGRQNQADTNRQGAGKNPRSQKWSNKKLKDN